MLRHDVDDRVRAHQHEGARVDRILRLSRKSCPNTPSLS
jgi:hypothetical protein